MITKPSEKEVMNALRKVWENREEKSLNYAVEYARLGMYMTGEALRVQVLYVLNNMTRWRGETAKKVRETLKAFTK